MKKVFCCLALIPLYLSCEMELNIEIPDSPPQLVVSSTLVPWTENPKYLGIEVYSSSHIFDETEKTPIDNATVIVYRDGQLFGQLNYLSENDYNFYPMGFSPLKGPLPGELYRVKVSAPDYESVWAETIIPAKIEITDCQIDRVGYFDDNGTVFSRVTLSFNDPAQQTNYYEIVVSDILCQYESFCYRRLTTNESFITSEAYYPTPVNPGLPNPTRLLFRDDTFDGQKASVNFYYFPHQKLADNTIYLYEGYVVVQLRHITEDYYKHYTTKQQARNFMTTDILYGGGEPINVYSNVNNGLGIVAGFNSSLFVMELDGLYIP